MNDCCQYSLSGDGRGRWLCDHPEGVEHATAPRSRRKGGNTMTSLRERLGRLILECFLARPDGGWNLKPLAAADAILADPNIAVVELPEHLGTMLFDRIETATAAEIGEHRGVVYLWDDRDPDNEFSAYGPEVVREAAAALLAAARKAEEK